jgi:hypothetical protein
MSEILNISAKEYHADKLSDKPSLSTSIAWEMEPSNLSGGSPLHGWLRHPRCKRGDGIISGS